MDIEELKEQISNIFAERERQESQEVDIRSQDLTQLFEKIMKPKKDYGVITKDLKTSNLDKSSLPKVVFMKSVAKDFIIYRDSFELENDIWIEATVNSIDGDAEIIASASQGMLAKLLDTFVTMKRESRVTSRLEKEKGGLFVR